MKAARTLLSARDLVVGYDQPVVGPLTFSVMRDDVVGLVGPNGSGKTTVFNAIVGVARVFEGQLHRQPEARISLQRQAPVRLREMPLQGRELLRLTGSLHASVPAPLEGLLDVRVDRVSGGQFQLLQVWASLGAPSDLVLLDEPTNNMDPGAIEALAHLVGNGRVGRGILVISHEHEFLERVCTRIVDLSA